MSLSILHNNLTKKGLPWAPVLGTMRLRLREVNLQKGTSWALSPDLCDPSFASQAHFLPLPWPAEMGSWASLTEFPVMDSASCVVKQVITSDNALVGLTRKWTIQCLLLFLL